MFRSPKYYKKIEEQNLDKPNMYDQKHAKVTYAKMYFWNLPII